jgi:hypothetical protein
VSDRIDVEDTNVDFFDKRINTLKKIKSEKVHVKRNSLSKIVSGKTVTEESVASKVRLHVCEQQASNGGKKSKGVRKGAGKSIKGSDKVKDGAEEKNKKGKKLVRKRKCEVETKEKNKRMRSAVDTVLFI